MPRNRNESFADNVVTFVHKGGERWEHGDPPTWPVLLWVELDAESALAVVTEWYATVKRRRRLKIGLYGELVEKGKADTHEAA